MKPLLKYRGGKSKEIPHLIKHIPKYNGRYIEPFFGGGALFFHLEPKRAIINDINSKLISFYLGVKNDFDTLKEELSEIERVYSINRRKFEELKSKTPDKRVEDRNEALYYQIRDMFNELTEKKYSMILDYFYWSTNENKTLIMSGTIDFPANKKRL
jgi:DNA adenine methylase